MAIEQHRVGVEGVPISYVGAGEGPPLVLLHGAGDNSLDWRWVMPALARTHRVYAPDLPGSPDSARPAADYSPAFFGRFVAGFLDALGIEHAAIVGNLLGGLIALRVALSEPARLTALVLVDSASLGVRSRSQRSPSTLWSTSSRTTPIPLQPYPAVVGEFLDSTLASSRSTRMFRNSNS